MADDSSQEKTEDATPKKLREARKKGQVPKSKDLTTGFELLFIFIAMCFLFAYMGQSLKELMSFAFKMTSDTPTMAQLFDLGKLALLTFVKMIAPLAIVGFIIALAVGFLQIGPVFATEPLMPKFEKLNMIEGLKNMFKAQTFIELAKNIVKIVAIFIIAYYTLKGSITTVVQSPRVPVEYSLSLVSWILFKFMVRVLILFIIIAVADFWIQRKQFMKQMRMSKDEVKREYKQDEGDPHIKSHRRQMHREFVFGDVRSAVKKADAVVTNPVHVAVAICYNRDEMVAPEIVASGREAFAKTIKAMAEEYEVPIIRNVALAWALEDLEIGAEIPEDLYAAVAEILSYVYKMKEAQQARPDAQALI